MWLSLVEYSVRDAGVGGSNPLIPTININGLQTIVSVTLFCFLPYFYPSVILNKKCGVPTLHFSWFNPVLVSRQISIALPVDATRLYQLPTGFNPKCELSGFIVRRV